MNDSIEPKVDGSIKKHLDDVVIIVTVALSFLAAIIFAVMMSRGQFFPPTLLAMLLGISISALTYRFLGGTDGTKFSVGLLGVGGSAALLLGTTWFVGDKLKNEFKIYDESKSYINEINELEDDIVARDARLVETRISLKQLEERIRKLPTVQTDLILEHVKNLKAGDNLVVALRRMVKAGEPPFVETLRSIPAHVAIVAAIGDRSVYYICPGTYASLYEKLEANTRIRISRSKGEDGEPVNDTLDRAGFIDRDKCTETSPQFDVQIGCATALHLFGDKIKSCAETASLRGAEVTLSALPNN